MTYKCYMCKREFDCVRTDEEAQTEKNRIFGNVPPEDCEIVCDVCFRLLQQMSDNFKGLYRKNK